MLYTSWPYLLYGISNESNYSDLLMNILSFMFVFLFIIGAAYFTSKYIGGKSSTIMGSKNIKVIEKMILGLDKAIYIIQLGNQYYLIATGKHTIELLDKVSASELEVLSPKSSLNPSKSFNQHLDSILSRKDISKDNTIEDTVIVPETLKDKLKEMKKRTQQIGNVIDKDENQ